MAESSNNNGRVPPHSRDAEEAVLGAMMLEQEAVHMAFEKLGDSNVFYFEAHRRIFRAMTTLFEEAEPIDQLTVCTKLEEMGSLEKVGGSFYVTGLLERTPSAANVDYHLEIVKQRALLRDAISVGTGIVTESYAAKENAYEMLDRFEHRIFELQEGRLKEGFQPIEPYLHETMEVIDKYSKTKGFVTGVPSGFDDLDKKTAGFQASNLIIIAARPSIGKTALALSMLRHMAVKHNIPVGFFSLEMSAQEIALRLLCMEANVSSHEVKTRSLSPEKHGRLSPALGRLHKSPIYIDDTPAIGPLELRAKARRIKADKNIGALFIDYLQLMSGPPGVENRQQEISTISRTLKATSKELGIPIIALSQLSRAPEQRGKDKRPQLSDLRESGALEQDADVVLFIYRESMNQRSEEGYQQPKEDVAELIIGKQRNGPTGVVSLTFLTEFARFEPRAFDADVAPW